MHRFYIDKTDIKDCMAVIKDGDVKHITKVLRLGIGDRIAVCDGDNTDYDGVIKHIYKEKILVGLSGPRPSGTEPPIEIVLFQAAPKSAKMDLIIQKGTEIGISIFIPMLTSRTEVSFNDNSSDKKIKRWQRIAEEAAKQSRRGRIPRILLPLTFSQVLDSMEGFDICIMPCVCEEQNTISDVMVQTEEVRRVAILIGPEGGFDRTEMDKARSKGVYTVKMGPRILRTETAGLVLSSILMYCFGDLGGVR